MQFLKFVGALTVFLTACSAAPAPIPAELVDASLAKRDMSADDVCRNIQTLTTLSFNLQASANAINLLSGPLFLIGQGPIPQVIIGFTQIVQTATADVSAMGSGGLKPFSVKSDEQKILNSFREFVQIHQELLSIMIGKAGLLEQLPFVGPPVAAVLRSLESIVDTLAYGIIDAIPDFSDDAKSSLGGLDVQIGVCITKYDGLSL